MKVTFYVLQLTKVKSEISEVSNNPQSLLLEAIHSAGYSGALANPLLAPESAINRLNPTLLEEFVAVSPLCGRCLFLSLIKSQDPLTEILSENFRKIILVLGWYLLLLVLSMTSWYL